MKIKILLSRTMESQDAHRWDKTMDHAPGGERSNLTGIGWIMPGNRKEPPTLPHSQAKGRRFPTRAVLGILLGLVLLAGVLVGRTLIHVSRQAAVDPVQPIALDAEAAAERLAQAIRIPTLSPGVGGPESQTTFRDLHAHLEAAYPKAHGTLTREVVGGGSLMMTWPGADPRLRPILLMGHLDVVPVEPDARWTHSPFSGRVADGFIWGRGALDDKGSVIAMLEAVEGLLQEGHRPKRTIYLAFGHDEEIGGRGGAALIAQRLLRENVRLECVLDEGGTILKGSALPVEAPAALVGIAEKGYLSLSLTAEGKGGHSSMPPRETAAGIVSAAVARLQERPFPGAIRGPVREMFDSLAPEMQFLPRVLFSNLWLFAPLVERGLSDSPSSDAMLRTTIAPTMLEGSLKDNVLPTRARAAVNFRLVPGDTVEGVTERVRRTIADPRVQVAPLEDGAWNPSPVSSTRSECYRTLSRTIRAIFPDAVVAPYLTLGATDSRHYQELAENVYRFLPVRFTPEDLQRMHGTDERIAVSALADAVLFYRRFISEST